MAWYTCSDCDYMNMQDKNSYGDCYCYERHAYYNPADTICNRSKIKGRDVGGSSNCYLTTCCCDVLGLDDNCNYLDILRNFRDSYMKKQVDCYDMLREYREIGPYISNEIKNSPFKDYIAEEILEEYVIPAIVEINDGNFEESIDKYVEMTNALYDAYVPVRVRK